MASEELKQLVAGLRENGPDFTAPPAEVRVAFEEMLATIPVAEDLAFEDAVLGGVPVIRAAAPGAGEGALLYFHGGAYVIGSARGYRGLAAELGRAAGLPAVAVEYRLAPEHVFPAALDDALAAYRVLLESGADPARVVFAGDSAGAGLALAALVRARVEGLPMPAAGLLISPWADLACEGATIASKAADDPSLTAEGLRAMAALYLDGGDARDPRASPLRADLSGLPPLLVQVGSAEILLDDAIRIAAAAGASDTPVQLEVWAEMVHVWHAFAFMLPEGREAVAAAGRFLRERLGA